LDNVLSGAVRTIRRGVASGIFKIGSIFAGADKTAYERFRSWFEPFNIFSSLKANTLSTNEIIFAAVSRLSNAMGSMPLKLYHNYDVVNTQTSDLLINNPNPNMTGLDFIRTMESHRNTSGNGYAIKDYDNTFQTKALWILDPAKVNPVIEKDTRELWYEIHGDQGRYYVHNMDMIHVKHIHTVGYLGISPIDVLKNTIDFDARVKEFSLDQLEGAIRASFILKVASNLSEDKKTEMLQSFREFYKNNGGVLIQEQGTEIKEIERKFIDSQDFDIEKITRTRVAIVYNMPPYMLGETEGLNYASGEHQHLDFVEGTLAPIVRQYEQEFSRKLLTKTERQRGMYFKFNLRALLRADVRTQSDAYFRQIRSGMLTPNEARALEDRPPLEGGDELLVSRDLEPISKRGEKGNGQN